uniref:Uncharacterized protein n=1 Tax=Oryza sativa subsp. japonica TaxID=39947 RepID=Q67TQ7_ORYSJ|nr:hypothetical protein [Oryza sativa Japonica Group]BAD38464.1 hypothetical protein [Oryza sativa Japonica Group]
MTRRIPTTVADLGRGRQIWWQWASVARVKGKGGLILPELGKVTMMVTTRGVYNCREDLGRARSSDVGLRGLWMSMMGEVYSLVAHMALTMAAYGHRSSSDKS